MLLVICIIKMSLLLLFYLLRAGITRAEPDNPIEDLLFIKGLLLFPILLLCFFSIISTLREQPLALGSVSSECSRRSKYSLQNALISSESSQSTHQGQEQRGLSGGIMAHPTVPPGVGQLRPAPPTGHLHGGQAVGLQLGPAGQCYEELETSPGVALLGAGAVSPMPVMRAMKKFQNFTNPIFVLEMYDIYPLALYPKVGTSRSWQSGRQCYNTF